MISAGLRLRNKIIRQYAGDMFKPQGAPCNGNGSMSLLKRHETWRYICRSQKRQIPISRAGGQDFYWVWLFRTFVWGVCHSRLACAAAEFQPKVHSYFDCRLCVRTADAKVLVCQRWLASSMKMRDCYPARARQPYILQ